MEKLPADVAAIGMVWYREADYDALLKLFIDPSNFYRSFLQWQDAAEQGRKRYIREGKIVVKAYIDPKTFAAWCDANGCKLDANGRTQFANQEAYRVVMEADKHS